MIKLNLLKTILIARKTALPKKMAADESSHVPVLSCRTVIHTSSVTIVDLEDISHPRGLLCPEYDLVCL